MTKVLLTVHKFFPEHRAGTEVLTLKIAQELLRRDYEVLVVTANPPDTDARYRAGEEIKRYTHEGVDVISFEEPLRLKSYKFSFEYLHPGMSAQFKAVLEEFRPDLVHIIHAQNLSAGIVEEAKAAGLPVVMSPTDFWFICPIVQLKRPDGQVCEGPGPGAQNCFTCYTPELMPPQSEFVEAIDKRFPSFTRNLGKVAGPLGNNMLYFAYLSAKLPQALKATAKRPAALRDIANMVDGIMVPTLLMKRLFIKNGIREDLIHHVPFGIDTSKLEDWKEKTPCEEVRIGYIGTLFEHKGVDLLIKAFQSMKCFDRAVVKIYGSLDQFPEYSLKLKQLRDSCQKTKDKIEFLGTFPNDQFGKILSEIDVLVIPSRWYENTPLVMQSALATVTPLIATNLGGMSELIDNGENGLLFELNDHEDLARQLTKVVEQPDLLAKFKSNITKQRTINDMVDDIESLYNASLKKHGAACVSAQINSH